MTSTPLQQRLCLVRGHWALFATKMLLFHGVRYNEPYDKKKKQSKVLIFWFSC